MVITLIVVPGIAIIGSILEIMGLESTKKPSHSRDNIIDNCLGSRNTNINRKGIDTINGLEYTNKRWIF